MANRTTAKANVVSKNVPTVTNAILTDILNADMNDNIVFREDVAAVQSSGVSSITVDFSGKDRIELSRTGGSLSITVSGLDDGDLKYLLITKTAGQAISFVGVTDVTPITPNVNAVSLVLYEIFRKGSNYYARAVLETVKQATTSIPGIAEIATSSEHNALSSTSKMCVPGYLPISSTSQQGLAERATTSEAAGGTDSTRYVTSAGVKAYTENVDSFTALSKNSGFSGNIHYRKDPTGMVHWRIWNLVYNSNVFSTAKVQIGTVPAGYTPNVGSYFPILQRNPANDDLLMSAISIETQGDGSRIYLHGDPNDYTANWILDAYLVYNPAL